MIDGTDEQFMEQELDELLHSENDAWESLASSLQTGAPMREISRVPEEKPPTHVQTELPTGEQYTLDEYSFGRPETVAGIVRIKGEVLVLSPTSKLQESDKLTVSNGNFSFDIAGWSGSKYEVSGSCQAGAPYGNLTFSDGRNHFTLPYLSGNGTYEVNGIKATAQDGVMSWHIPVHGSKSIDIVKDADGKTSITINDWTPDGTHKRTININRNGLESIRTAKTTPHYGYQTPSGEEELETHKFRR